LSSSTVCDLFPIVGSQARITISTTAVDEAKAKAGNKVQPGEQVIISHDSKTDAYGLKYTELVSPVIKAIQQLYGECTALVARVTTLEVKDAAKDKEIAALKATAERAEQENTAIKAYLCGKDPSAAFCH
jgi:hypothetical protein